jgi:hypothetical protein
MSAASRGNPDMLSVRQSVLNALVYLIYYITNLFEFSYAIYFIFSYLAADVAGLQQMLF